MLEFAVSEDVKNAHLDWGARRALVRLFWEGWCTSEFVSLPQKTRQSVEGRREEDYTVECVCIVVCCGTFDD